MTTTTDEYVYIDSATRDIAAYPTKGYFRFRLQTPLSNVLAVEPLAMTLPVVASLYTTSYVMLDILELNHLLAGANQTPAFAVFQFSSPLPATYDQNSYVSMDKKAAERSPVRYDTPKAKLDTLTIAIKDRKGGLIDFGVDDPSAGASDQQILVMLKVTCETRSAAALRR